MLSSQINPFNNRFKANTKGSKTFATDANGISPYFEISLKTYFRINDIFDANQFDLVNFSDYITIYKDYTLSDYAIAQTADGTQVNGFGFFWNDEYGDLIDATTGEFNNPNTISVVDGNFTYNIINVIWGLAYNSPVYYNGVPTLTISQTANYPFLLGTSSPNTTFTLKNNNRVIIKN